MSLRWIITGANGYLGGQLCRQLHGRGDSVIGVARSGRSLRQLADMGISCHTYDDLPSILSSGDVFVHCAGKTGSSGVWDDYVKVNRDWSSFLFDQASTQGVSCFIYVSSVAALGYMPRSENEILDESSLHKHARGELYGRSKLAAEQALQERAGNSSTRLLILRPGLIYGKRYISSSRPVVVDRGQRVPLVHIDNFAEAVVRVADHTSAQGVFLVVDDEQPTLRDLNALKMKYGLFRSEPRHIGRAGFWMMWLCRSAVRVLSGRVAEISRDHMLAEYYFQTRRLLYSTEKLRALVGWIPLVSLENGLEMSRTAIKSVNVIQQKKRMITPTMLFRAAYNRLALKADRGPTGLGLIGVGGWGSTNAANIMRSRRFNIVGAYDQKTQSARRFASRFRTKCFKRMDELLDDPGIQAIAATVPNQFHADVVKAAADAGKHIFIEKPLASDPEICRELGQYCREKRVVLQVGHQMRREPVFREMKRILKGGALGQPLYAQAVYTLDRRSRDDWRQDADSCPGGSMEQLGAHLIDVLIYLFGLPSDTQSWAENIPRISGAPDWGSVSLSFDHNVHAVISTSFSSPSHMRLEVFFDGGHLATDGHTLWISHTGSNPRKIKPKGLAGGVAQFIEFADCIERGKEPETGAIQAVAVMDVVRSIYSG